MSKVTSENLNELFSHILSDIVSQMAEDSQQYLEKCYTPDEIEKITKHLKAYDVNKYRNIVIKNPLQVTEYLIDQIYPNIDKERRGELIFFINHYDFLKRILENVLIKNEGLSCSSDKSRFILNAIKHYLMSDQNIILDYDQKYTFHLPKKILNTEEKILAFFEAVYYLHYGKPEKYLNINLNEE